MRVYNVTQCIRGRAVTGEHRTAIDTLGELCSQMSADQQADLISLVSTSVGWESELREKIERQERLLDELKITTETTEYRERLRASMMATLLIRISTDRSKLATLGRVSRIIFGEEETR